MNTNNNSFPSTLLVFCALVFFYTPIFGHEFAYHNDYRIFDYDVRNCCTGFPETPSLLAIGRPILALLLNLQLMFITDMYSLWLAHIFSVLMIALLASVCAIYFERELNITRWGAMILSFLMFTLPSMVVNSFWVTNFVSQILTLFIALFAHILFQRRNSDQNRIFIIAVVFALLFANLLIYPPAAMFFLSLTFIKLIFGTRNPANARLSDIRDETLIMMSACTSYFVFIKFLWLPFLIYSKNLFGFDWEFLIASINKDTPNYEFSIALNFPQKLAQVQEFLIMIFSSWFDPMSFQSIILFIIGFIFTMAWSAKRSPYLRELRTTCKIFWWLTLAIFIASLTALPILAGPSEYKITYRAIFATMIIIPVAIVFVADRILLTNGALQVQYRKIFIPILLFTIITITAAEISSLNRLINVIKYASIEFQHIYNALSRDVNERTKEIRVETPMIYLATSRISDFGLTGEHMEGLVKAALKKIELDPDNYKIVMNRASYNNITDEVVVVSRFPQGTKIITKELLIGEWSSQGKVAKIIYKDNTIFCINEMGVSVKAEISGLKKMSVNEWGVHATLSMNGKVLQWSNGSTWIR